nr:MAG TPA: hypothetical protein [Caudoviricetes sp.]
MSGTVYFGRWLYRYYYVIDCRPLCTGFSDCVL